MTSSILSDKALAIWTSVSHIFPAWNTTWNANTWPTKSCTDSETKSFFSFFHVTFCLAFFIITYSPAKQITPEAVQAIIPIFFSVTVLIFALQFGHVQSTGSRPTWIRGLAWYGTTCAENRNRYVSRFLVEIVSRLTLSWIKWRHDL